MKKGITLGSLLIVIILAMAPTSSDAFNPLAHIYIADKACSDCIPKIDYFYGSIAPDLAWFVANPEEDWETVVFDTHYRDIRRFAWGTTQEAFAAGWLTHSEKIGADYFAHKAYTRSPSIDGPTEPGYVIEKADLLFDVLLDDPFELPDDDQTFYFAHYIIEATIDFMLIELDSSLPGKLLFANLFRSCEDRNLMMRVFVWRWWDKRTDWWTLATAESALRQLINRYAIAFMLSNPEEALAQLAVELAKEVYNLDIDAGDLLDILKVAINLCKDDYLDVIKEAITAVSAQLN